MRRVAAILTVPAVVAAAVLLTAGPSTAVDVSMGGLPDGGSVTIQTGFSSGAGRITTVLTDESGAEQPPVVQQVADDTCDALGPGPVAITASGQACYRSLGFGVDPGRDGLAWYERFLDPNVKAGETLSLSMTDDRYVFLGKVSLDIEAVRLGEGDDVQLTSYLGDQVVETLTLDLTNRVVRQPPNYRVDTQLTKGADRLELTALGSTRFQLEGDTSNRRGSTFALARVTDVVPCQGGKVTLENGATLVVDGGEGCTDEPIVFAVDEAGDVVLRKEISDAKYRLTLPFTTGDDPLARVQVDYDVDGPAPYVRVNDCDGSTAAPALAADENTLTGSAPVPQAEWDGFCEAGRSTTLRDDQWTVVVTLFGANDPKFRFR